MPRLLAVLEEILAEPPKPRLGRDLYELLIGLCAGFPNWGSGMGSERLLFTIYMMVDSVVEGSRGTEDDPTFLNLAGVTMAEASDELERLGRQNDEADTRTHAQFAPKILWTRAAELDTTFASPVYNLARYAYKRGDVANATQLLMAARQRLIDHGGNAMVRPTMFYPVKADNSVGLDRLLTIASNTARFTHRSNEARWKRFADLLRWRIEEALGDLALKRGDRDAALRHYTDAGKTAPDICTEAMRKMVALAETEGRRDIVIAALEHLIKINPMDLPHRVKLSAEYEKIGKVDEALREEIRLLSKAVVTPRAFDRPPFDEL